MITVDDLVRRRIANFWGYGSFKAPVWFVGMEEGLGPEAELEERFKAADGRATIDMRRDMVRVPEHMRWFKSPSPPIQQSWKYPIALALSLKNGAPSSPEEIRSYQLKVLGDIESEESCVIEILPLPARSTAEADWSYSSYVGSRQQYVERYKPERVCRLRSLIAENRPHLVIFHGLTYLADWTQVIGSMPRQLSRQMYFVTINHTAFCVIPNANSRGMSYDRVHEFAGLVRQHQAARRMG